MTTPKEYYDANGYYVFRNIIPESLINQLLEQYKTQILPSKKPFFRQSSNRWETNIYTEQGYSKESFRDVHDYPDYPQFCDATRQIFCHPAVREALTQLTESAEHNVMQTMMFDFNTATPAHQDWYYLDSLPNGHLLAGWFALEDIREEAGRFFVVPKSHLVDFDLTEDEKISNAPYQKKLKEYMAQHKDEIKAPALKKGDILFWNSRTIHGALETQNHDYSRKSLTCHYLPSHYAFGARYETTPRAVEYGVYQGMKYRVIPSEYKQYSVSHKLKTDLLQFLWNQPKLMRVVQMVRQRK